MQTPRSVKMEREEVRWSRDSPAARGEMAGCPPAAHEEIPLQAVEDPMLEQVAGPGEGHDSVGKPTLEQFMEDCSPWKGLALEKPVEG